MLKNILEIVVEQKFDDLIKNGNFCKCQRCREDVLAIVLNNLPPRYVSTDAGELFARASMLSQNSEREIVCELAKAMKLVGDKPRHVK